MKITWVLVLTLTLYSCSELPNDLLGETGRPTLDTTTVYVLRGVIEEVADDLNGSPVLINIELGNPGLVAVKVWGMDVPDSIKIIGLDVEFGYRNKDKIWPAYVPGTYREMDIVWIKPY